MSESLATPVSHSLSEQVSKATINGNHPTPLPTNIAIPFTSLHPLPKYEGFVHNRGRYGCHCFGFRAYGSCVVDRPSIKVGTLIPYIYGRSNSSANVASCCLLTCSRSRLFFPLGQACCGNPFRVTSVPEPVLSTFFLRRELCLGCGWSCCAVACSREEIV